MPYMYMCHKCFMGFEQEDAKEDNGYILCPKCGSATISAIFKYVPPKSTKSIPNYLIESDDSEFLIAQDEESFEEAKEAHEKRQMKSTNITICMDCTFIGNKEIYFVHPDTKNIVCPRCLSQNIIEAKAIFMNDN